MRPLLTDRDPSRIQTSAITGTQRRRLLGALLGGGLGLAYEGAAEAANGLALSGIPYFAPPLGPLDDILSAFSGEARWVCWRLLDAGTRGACHAGQRQRHGAVRIARA